MQHAAPGVLQSDEDAEDKGDGECEGELLFGTKADASGLGVAASWATTQKSTMRRAAVPGAPAGALSYRKRQACQSESLGKIAAAPSSVAFVSTRGLLPVQPLLLLTGDPDNPAA